MLFMDRVDGYGWNAVLLQNREEKAWSESIENNRANTVLEWVIISFSVAPQWTLYPLKITLVLALALVCQNVSPPFLTFNHCCVLL